MVADPGHLQLAQQPFRITPLVGEHSYSASHSLEIVSRSELDVSVCAASLRAETRLTGYRSLSFGEDSLRIIPLLGS